MPFHHHHRPPPPHSRSVPTLVLALTPPYHSRPAFRHDGTLPRPIAAAATIICPSSSTTTLQMRPLGIWWIRSRVGSGSTAVRRRCRIIVWSRWFTMRRWKMRQLIPMQVAAIAAVLHLLADDDPPGCLGPLWVFFALVLPPMTTTSLGSTSLCSSTNDPPDTTMPLRPLSRMKCLPSFPSRRMASHHHQRPLLFMPPWPLVMWI